MNNNENNQFENLNGENFSQPVQPTPQEPITMEQLLKQTPVQPMPQVQAAQPVQPTPQVQAAQPVQPTPQVQAAQPVQPIPQVQAAQPVHPKPQVQSAQPVQPIPQVQAAQPVQPMPQVQAAQPVQPIPQVQAAQPVQPISQVQAAQPVQPMTQVQAAQPVQPTQQASQPNPQEPVTMGQLMRQDNELMQKESHKHKPSKRRKFPIVLVFLLIVIAGLGYFGLKMINDPYKIYQTLVKMSVNEIYDLAYQNEDKISGTINLDFELKENDIDETFGDLINKTTLGLNYQVDKVKKQFVLSVDSDYDNEPLINLQAFVDAKNKKSYIYAKDFYDKYINVDMEDYEIVDEIFNNNPFGLKDINNTDEVKQILVDELATMIKPDDCTKENGNLVFKITAKDYVDRLKMIAKSLNNNKEFLGYFEKQDLIKDMLDSFYSALADSDTPNEVLTITISKKLFSVGIEKMTITTVSGELIIDVEGEGFKYEIKKSGELTLSGNIKINKTDNTKKYDVSMDIPELMKVNLTFMLETGKEIDRVDSSKVVLFEDITETEQIEIMNKIESSKIYEVVMSIMESFGFSSDDEFEDDYDDFGDEYY